MASAVVGALRVILSADTAEFKSGLDQATKITGDFSGKLTGLQAQVQGFSNVFGKLFTVAAISSAAREVLLYADRLEDLADKTGLTVESLQEMDFAAKQTGSSLESFTNAAFKLGINLAEGTDKVRGAVAALGLSYDQLRASSPDEQFRATMIALEDVEDVTERNRLGNILYGRGFKELAGAVNEGWGEMARQANKASKEQIDALAEAGKQWDTFKNQVLGVGIQIGASFATQMGHLKTALKQDLEFLNEYVGVVRITQQAVSDWGAIFGRVGDSPKPFSTAVKSLPEPLKAATMSVEDLAKAEKRLTEEGKASIEANKKRIESLEKLKEAQERFAASIQRLDTAEFFVPFKKTVHEANFELEELESSLPSLATNFVRLKASVAEADMSFETFGDRIRSTMIQLPTVILQAIQGGGSIIGSAGSFIGTSLMEKFSEKYGKLIKDALPFGLGNAVVALLPTLGALFGPVAEKIAGFFRRIFGGPDAEEMAGRSQVAAFEEQLHDLLNQTQLNEAGNEDWKKTVIAIRDAYLAAGKSEAEAMAAAERLWQSSKRGAAETAAAIKAIQDVLNQTEAEANDLDAAMDNVFRDRSFTVTEDRVVNETIVGDREGQVHEAEFAGGTMGTLGQWFGNFGSGMGATLHGMEAVVTPEQAPAFAMDVLGRLSSPQQQQAAQATPQPITIHNAVESRILLDSTEMKRWILKEITIAIENNERGIRSQQRDALGITT